jgi:hypothetical protein
MFFTGDPTDRFMLWTRRALLLVWVVLLVVQLPTYIHQAQRILSNVTPGAEQNAAIRGLAVEALVMLIVVPLSLFAVLGYGIGVTPAAWLTGRPWFAAWWHPRQRQKPPRNGRR